MFTFKLDEAEIPAGVAVRVVTTDLRTAFINCAASLGLIEKHAHRFVDVIFTMPKHAYRFALVLNRFREALARTFNRNSVVFGQAGDIAWLRFNVVVAAAIARTLAAVVSNFVAHA